MLMKGGLWVLSLTAAACSLCSVTVSEGLPEELQEPN